MRSISSYKVLGVVEATRYFIIALVNLCLISNAAALSGKRRELVIRKLSIRGMSMDPSCWQLGAMFHLLLELVRDLNT